MSAAVSVLDAAILSTRQGKNTNKIRDNDVLRRIFSIEGDHRGGGIADIRAHRHGPYSSRMTGKRPSTTFATEARVLSSDIRT